MVAQIKPSRKTRSSRGATLGQTVRTAKSLDLGARARCSSDSPSLGFGSWNDFSRHPIHLVRSPENLLHLRSNFSARGFGVHFHPESLFIYPLVLRHGLRVSWLDLELGLWRALAESVKKVGRDTSLPPSI